MQIHTKRIYDGAAKADGNRVLVDKLWPRGVSKEEAKLDQWWKEIAPSSDLRKWFGHDPDKWSDFKKKYRSELKEKKDDIRKFLKETDQRKRLTLLYGARDERHNHAVVLKEYLEDFEK